MSEPLPKFKVMFGIPEYWDTAYRDHTAFFERVGNVQKAHMSLVNRAYSDVEARHILILNISILVANGFHEIVTLVGNGMGLGAMKLVRNLAENTINAEYLRRVPAEAQNYLDWRWVELHKDYLWMQKFATTELGLEELQSIAENETEYQRVHPKFAKYKQGQMTDEDQPSWCKHDLAFRAKVSGLETMYRTAVRAANQFLHGTVSGLLYHADRSGGDKRIKVYPSRDWSSQALVVAHEAAVKNIETLANTFSVQPDPRLDQLVTEFHEVWANHAE